MTSPTSSIPLVSSVLTGKNRSFKDVVSGSSSSSTNQVPFDCTLPLTNELDLVITPNVPNMPVNVAAIMVSNGPSISSNDVPNSSHLPVQDVIPTNKSLPPLDKANWQDAITVHTSNTLEVVLDLGDIDLSKALEPTVDCTLPLTNELDLVITPNVPNMPVNVAAIMVSNGPSISSNDVPNSSHLPVQDVMPTNKSLPPLDKANWQDAITVHTSNTLEVVLDLGDIDLSKALEPTVVSESDMAPPLGPVDSHIDAQSFLVYHYHCDDYIDMEVDIMDKCYARTDDDLSFSKGRWKRGRSFFLNPCVVPSGFVVLDWSFWALSFSSSCCSCWSVVYSYGLILLAEDLVWTCDCQIFADFCCREHLDKEAMLIPKSVTIVAKENSLLATMVDAPPSSILLLGYLVLLVDYALFLDCRYSLWFGCCSFFEVSAAGYDLECSCFLHEGIFNVNVFDSFVPSGYLHWNGGFGCYSLFMANSALTARKRNHRLIGFDFTFLCVALPSSSELKVPSKDLVTATRTFSLGKARRFRGDF
ncbi:hypothetical protein MA16_Dca026581 [Dendrobium catenatum]|uniref:Uncharacterized protein n=1 Tax=Dendrobium catenatum TaxID=906689 RepID=A0A2I0VD63_9ASPA|nr:hypothetical protein MA16_Dca026581 [Dendrobium catenatum]